MPVVYVLEPVKSVYQKKMKQSYSFTDENILCQVMKVLLEEWSCNYRVCKISLKDDECLDLQEMARENTKSMEELNEEERELTIEDILGVLVYGHD